MKRSKKRAKNSDASAPKTRQRVVFERTLAFDVTSPLEGRSDFSVRSVGGSSFAKGDDSFHFELLFHTPLRKSDAAQSTLRLTYLPAHRSDTYLTLLPHTDTKNVSKFGTLLFLVFPSHAVQLEHNAVTRLYVCVENMQTNGADATPVLKPVVDMSVFFAAQVGARYAGLEFYPPDAALLQEHNLSIQASRVPQRNPLWFKLRGEITSSLVSKLLGFYVPTLEEQARTQWHIGHNDFAGNNWKLARVRFGRIKEDHAVLCYLLNYPARVFSETGYHEHPQHPETWGASPDGLVLDADMTLDKLPETTRAHFDKLLDAARVRNGVIEIKSSQANCRFNGYFIPQLMWEMICARTVWGDLLRYCERRARLEDGRWGQVTEAKCIRLYRDAEKENRVMQLIVPAHALYKANKTREFIQLVHSPPYVQIREEFEEIARQCTAAAASLEMPLEALAALDAYKRDAVQRQDADVEPALHPALDRIDDRNATLLNHFNEDARAAFVSAAVDQMLDYGVLVKHMMEKK